MLLRLRNPIYPAKADPNNQAVAGNVFSSKTSKNELSKLSHF
jgi:hypothetical protein